MNRRSAGTRLVRALALLLLFAPGTCLALDLEEAARAAAGLPRLRSLLVSWRGELILERYFNGARAARATNIKSASKSLLSALVGIAIERGLIAGVHTPISTFFPDIPGAGAEPRKREITIEDLLTMRSGLESTSSRNYGAWVQSPNWVRYTLSRPLVSPPGTRMIYSTGNTHLLSAILTKASGMSTWQFARDHLARPLGFELPQWPRDPQGIYFGGNDMELTPRNLLAFGLLYLQRGSAGGRQIVPAAWVDTSFVPRTLSPRGFDARYYGYGWWIREMAGFQVYYAWGYGGQFVFVVPDAELVAVATSTTSAEDRRGYNGQIFDLLETRVLAPLAAERSRGGR